MAWGGPKEDIGGGRHSVAFDATAKATNSLVVMPTTKSFPRFRDGALR